MQNTRFNKYQSQFSQYLSSSFIGPWKRRSIAIISLLFGYYLGSNLTVYFLQTVGQRAFVASFMVILIEVLIRLRSNISKKPWPLHWLAIDNLRIGSVYSVVLEAFKLGS